MITAEGQRPRGRRPAARARLAAVLVALAGLLLFLLQNLQSVSVHFLWFEWRPPMLAALIVAAVVGAIAAAVFPYRSQRP